MTTSNNGSVLKDVVVYVDVWSSDKTANYSQPFVQQLQEMGAQVTKTFNKQVTHVVFNNGHLATWRKAKKGDVRLVSVLWVGRCYDDGVRVDEELYPAYNDESNLMLKNKRHRCMQPKDSPERTPENDRRMRKKLDKMMKDIAKKQPLFTDVSPIIIDEENGIVYSPALKRSDYMAQRLKDMKEKRENLSPTASQMIESCSTTGSTPSLGSTPTILKFMYDQSDDDSSASVAEPAYSPDREEGRMQSDVTDHDTPEQRHRKGSKKPWLSPCQDAPKQTSSHVKCQDFQDEEANRPKKSRMTSVRKHLNSGSFSESPSNDRSSGNSKNFHKEKSKSEIKPSSPSPNKTDKGKAKMKTAKSFTETKTHFCSEAANSSSCFSSPAKLGDGAVKLSKETASPLQKKPKQLMRSKSIASGSTDGADDVFEDYFSPANHHPRLKRPPLPNLPVERDIQIPFELNPVPKKRQIRRSIGSETKSKKMRLLETSQQSYASSKPQNHPQQDAKESPPALETPGADLTLAVKRRRQSTLPFTSTTTSDAKKPRTASVPPTMSTEADTMSELQKNSVNVISHTIECE